MPIGGVTPVIPRLLRRSRFTGNLIFLERRLPAGPLLHHTGQNLSDLGGSLRRNHLVVQLLRFVLRQLARLRVPNRLDDAGLIQGPAVGDGGDGHHLLNRRHRNALTESSGGQFGIIKPAAKKITLRFSG